MRQLSSPVTVVYKFIFPAIWIAGFLVASFAMVSMRPAHFPWWLFPIGTVVGAAALLAFALPLKTVHLDGGHLVVSNFRRQIAIPLEEVVSVRQSQLSNPARITVTLRNPTEFGRIIRFIPVERTLYGDCATTLELRRLVGLPERG